MSENRLVFISTYFKSVLRSIRIRKGWPVLFLVLALVPISSFGASNQSLVYQGRIVRPDGIAPNSGTITFTLAVYSPAPGSCLLYSENQSINMTGSQGMFSLELGAGTRTDGGVHTFRDIFVNGKALSGLTCASGTSYTAGATDDRSLQVSFNDAGTVVNLSSMAIKSVPFALQAHEIDGWGLNNLVKVSSVGSPTTFTTAEMANAKLLTAPGPCAVSEILKWNGSAWSCSADATGGSPSDASYATKGIFQADTDAATSGLVFSSSGVLKVNSGTAANQIVKLDASSKLPAVDGSALTNLNADNISSGTLPISRGGTGASTKTAAFDALSPNSAKGDITVHNGTNNISLPRGSDGQVLTTDSAQPSGLKWAAVTAGTVTSVTGGTGLTGGTITSAGTLAVDVGTGANQIVQMTAASKLPAVDGSQLTNLSASQISSGTLPISKGGTGNSSFAGHAVIVSDLTGSQLQALNCASGSVITFDSSGYAVCGSGGSLGFLNGGNSFAAAAILGTNDSNTLSFETVNSTRMTIDTSGNVGIGTSSPGSLLNISKSQNAQTEILVDNTNAGLTAKAIVTAKNNSGNFVTMGVTSSSYSTGTALTSDLGYLYSSGTGGLALISADASAPMRFVTGGNVIANERVRIDSAGNVGIGTTSPATKLSVNGTIQVADGGEACSAGADGGMIRYNGGNLQFCNGSSWQTLGVSGAGLTNLNGLTASTQSFVMATSGTDFTISSSGSAHTFAIPNSSATARGLLTSTDWSTFNNKLGTSTAFSGDVSGAYNTTSVDKIKAAPVSISSLSSGNYLKYNGSAWVNASLSSSDITGALGYTPVNRAGDTMSGALNMSGSNVSNVGTMSLKGSTSGTLSMTVPATVTSYTLNWPAAVGSANQVLSTDASGNLTWATVASATNTFVNGGNSFGGSATLGTNDNNTLALKTNNTVAMTIDTAGNVGIGKVPGVKLDVNGTTMANAFGLDPNNYWDTTKFVVTGNVGVGTASPGAPLHVVGAQPNGSFIFKIQNTTSDGEILQVSNPAGNEIASIRQNTDDSGIITVNNASGTRVIQLAAKPTDVNYFNSGNVGIGTTSPATKLSVNGTIQVANGGESCAAGADGGMIRYNSGNLEFCNGSSWQTLGVSGAGLTNLNGLTVSTQSFVTATTGTDFTISSSGSAHTFAIPSASSSARGLLTSADWSTFNNKLGTSTSFSGDVSGTYNATSVDKIKAAPVSISSLSSGNYLKYNGSAWVNASLGSSDVTGALGYTPVNKAGDTMSGSLDLAGKNITNVGTLALKGSTSGTLSMTVPATVTSYTMNWPAAVGSANQVLSTDASGNLTWATVASATNTFVNGGNSFGGAATLGTNDNNSLAFKTNSSTRMTISNSGNIGIGRAPSTYNLDVNGDMRSYGNLVLSESSSSPPGGSLVVSKDPGATSGFNPLIAMERNGGAYTTLGLGYWANGTTDSAAAVYSPSSDLIFGSGTTAATERMRITTTGKVGIGTTSPNTILNVQGSGASNFQGIAVQNSFADNTNKGAVAFVGARKLNAKLPYTGIGTWDDGATRFLYVGGGGWQMPDATRIEFYTAPAYNETNDAGVARMIINNAGNVGIGVTNPVAPLEVNGEVRMSGATSGYAGFKSPAVGPSVTWTLPTADGSAGQFLKTDGSGNLTWGTSTAPGDATYAAKGIVEFNTDAATSGISLSSGVATVNSGTGANQIVKLDAASKLPAVDGSALTNLSAANFSSGTLPISRGGTNSGTALNNNRLMISASDAIVEAPAMTNGQIIVGSTGAAPAVATVGSSNGISLTTGAGSLSIGTNATVTKTANALVIRDGSGNFAAGAGTFDQMILAGSVSGNLTLQAPSTFSNFSLTLPSADGSAGQVLKTDGSGNLSWVSVPSSTTTFVNGGNSFGSNASLGTNDNKTLSFRTNNTNRMTIDANGAVTVNGVADSAPTAFQVNKNSQYTNVSYFSINNTDALGDMGFMIGNNSGTNGMKLWSAGTSYTPTLYRNRISLTNPANGGLGFEASNAAGDIRFSTGGDLSSSERMRISSSGNIGIGATSPNATLDLNGSLALSGDISPAQITANQNDYNPGSLSSSTVLRLNTDASRDITGLSGGADGRIISIINVGSNNIVLKDQSVSSGAANRFSLGADVTLAANQTVNLWYDSTSSRWRQTSGTVGGSATDPTKVSKSGDTMTGGLTISATTAGGTLQTINAGAGSSGSYKLNTWQSNGTEYAYITPGQFYMRDQNAPAGNTTTITVRGNTVTPNIYGIAENGARVGVLGYNSASAGTGAGVTAVADANPALIAESKGTTNDSMIVTSRSVTSGRLAFFEQLGSAFTGDALQMNMAAGSGSFTGNFINLQKNGSTQFSVKSDGSVGIGVSSPIVPLQVGPGSSLASSVNKPGGASTVYSQISNTTAAGSVSQVIGVNDGSRNTRAEFFVKDHATPGSGAWGLWGNFGTAGDQPFVIGNGDVERLRIDTSGRLGIGTNSPNTILDVNGAISQRGMAAPSVSAAGQGRIYFDSSANKFKISENGGGYADLVTTTGTLGFLNGGNSFGATANLGTNDANSLNLKTNNTTRMTIDNAGNANFASSFVGVNTTTASYASFGVLTKGSTYSSMYNPATMYLQDDQGQDVRFVVKSAYFVNPTEMEVGAHQGNGFLNTATNHPLTLGTNNTERMRIDTAGNVGIGTTSPSYPLHVQSTNTSTAATSVPTGYFKMTVSPTANVSAGAKRYAAGASATVPGANTFTIPEVLGTWSTADNSGSGNITNLNGGRFYSDNYGSATNVTGARATGENNGTSSTTSGVSAEAYNYAGTTTDMVGVSVYLEQSGGTVTNRYGVRIYAPTGTTTNNDYGVYQEGGQSNYFSGKVGVGTLSPRSALDVSGAITGKAALSVAAGTVDYANNNLAYTSQNCGSFALWNMKDGGSYTFALLGTTSAVCSFTAYSDSGTTALTVKMPPDHTATMAGKATVYTFLVLGTNVFVSWVPGY